MSYASASIREFEFADVHAAPTYLVDQQWACLGARVFGNTHGSIKRQINVQRNPKHQMLGGLSSMLISSLRNLKMR